MRVKSKNIALITVLLSGIVASIFIFISVAGSDQTKFKKWPPLPKTGFIKNKPATKADVDSDKAVFAFVHATKKSTPIKIKIPQYGILELGGKQEKLQIIVVQAEVVNGKNMLGYINIKTGKRAIALMKDVKLLGQKI